ncbi:MAG TPA: phytanoyl-CoA dioxygenase family protein [Pyrinomonadaceae bacterium]|nr:phytanoyl-CoA dioxygenase family protein [Pyrinomonadaceae bacterium]
MRNETQLTSRNESFLPLSVDGAEVDRLVSSLEADGIVVFPDLISQATLASMQQAFAARLQRLRWNNFDGYQKTEPYRHMVEDVLVLDQGFIDLVLHRKVKAVLNRYLGDQYELTEAKGWKSLPTRRDFHGWHGDAWYDQTEAGQIHREVKLAIYLTDVHSGAFNYIKGSHRKQHPRLVKNSEISGADSSQIAELLGPAGTAFLFDTSGIHRQSVPMLEQRQACFFNYHNPRVPLQQEDIDYYRYHPLILNAAFLGELTDEDQRILGFGNKTNFQQAFVRASQPSIFYSALTTAYNAEVRLRQLSRMVVARLKRTVSREVR